MPKPSSKKRRRKHGQIGSSPRRHLPRRPDSQRNLLPSVSSQLSGESAEVLFVAVRAAGVLRAFATDEYSPINAEVVRAIQTVTDHGLNLDESVGDNYHRRVAIRLQEINNECQQLAGNYESGIAAAKREVASLGRKLVKAKADVSSFETARDVELRRVETLQKSIQKWDEESSKTTAGGTSNAP